MGRPKPIELNEHDRVEVLNTLQDLANAFGEAAADCQPHALELKAHLSKRASRLAQLAALFAVLLLGCAQDHGRVEGPPLYVHLCEAMSAGDREAWGSAAADLNAERGEFVLFVGNGPPAGCSTVDVCEGRANAVGDDGCTVVVRYGAGEAWEAAERGLAAALEVAR